MTRASHGSTKPGIYLHSKGGRYRVLFTAHDSTNARAGQWVVVYVSMTTGIINSREETEFHERVRRTPPDPSAPCLCDARGQAGCRQHPGDESMVPRFSFESGNGR